MRCVGNIQPIKFSASLFSSASEIMRRSVVSRFARTCTLLNVPTTAAPQEFKMAPMKAQERSAFSYKSSDKGEEVGARNEAAFMNYEEVNPASIERKLAVPNLVNLLSVLPIYGAAFIVASVFWGIFLFDLYARKHYETVVISRPAENKI